MWLYGPKAKLSSKKKSYLWDWLFGDNQTIKKMLYRILLDTRTLTDVSHSALYLSEQKKELPTHQHSQGYYRKDGVPKVLWDT